MKKIKIILFLLCFLFVYDTNGQGKYIKLLKIEIFKIPKNQKKVSTWMFHRPNVITHLVIENKSEDTLKFNFESPNCTLVFLLNNKWSSEPFNFAYNDVLENEIVLPNTKRNISVQWLINSKVFSKYCDKFLINVFAKSYIIFEHKSEIILSSKTSNIIIKYSQ